MRTVTVNETASSRVMLQTASGADSIGHWGGVGRNRSNNVALCREHRWNFSRIIHFI